MPDALKDQVFEHLARLASVANLSEENRIAYDKALDRYRVSEIVNEDIRKEGIKEGIKAGEKKKQEDIAHNLKNMGMPAESIHQATGLSVEEISKL